MEHAAGTTPLHNKLLTYGNICDLTETWYQEAKGVGKWSPVTHAKDSKAPRSSFTQTKVYALVQWVSQLPSHMTRAMPLVIFVEKKDIGPTNV